MINDESTDRHAASADQRAYYLGVALVLAAGVLWSLNGALIKLLHQSGAGVGSVTIAMGRSLFGGLFLLPLASGRFRTLTVRKREAYARRKLQPAVLVCVLLFTLMTVCFVLANTRTKAANAIILQYTSTFWIYLLSARMLGERPGGRDIWILLLAMAGIGIIFADQAGTDLFGLCNALGAGLFYGLLTMNIRALRRSDAGAVTVMNCLGSALLLLPPALAVGHIGLSLREWGLLVLMGVVQFGIPYYLFSLGLSRIPAYHAGLITLIEPALVPVWTYLAVGELVPPATFVGGAVILAALCLFMFARRHQRR